MSSQALLVTFIYEIVVVDVVVDVDNVVVVKLLVVIEEVVVGKSIQLHITCKYLFTPGQGSP